MVQSDHYKWDDDVGLEDPTGVDISPATEPTLSAIANALASTAAADEDPLLATIDSDRVGLATEATLAAISNALSSTAAADQDPLLTEQQTPIGLEDTGGVQVDPATEPTLAAIAGALASNATDTLQTEQQTPIGLEDTTGTQVDPDLAPDYPNAQTIGHDLVAAGDLVVGPVSAARAEAVLITAQSTDGNTWSATVDWTDGAGNVFLGESAVDVGLDTVTAEWSRLVRKGPQVTVTFTDTSGAAANAINAVVDAHR